MTGDGATEAAKVAVAKRIQAAPKNAMRLEGLVYWMQ